MAIERPRREHATRRAAVLPGVVLLGILGGGNLLALAAEAPSPAASEHFSAAIAPLIAARCLECHSSSERKGGLDLTRRESALAGGDSGPALSAGNPAESLLWQRVLADEMPPEKPLPQKEKELLREWVAGGAAWSAEPIDPLRYSSERRAGRDWWSLQPVVRPTLPALSANPSAGDLADWPRTPIDQFILQRLASAGLSPSPPADRRVLLRRLTFDLWGLPPTPEAMDRFLADTSPNAYERLVDEMLASPHYGERLARHWLDIARFGESQGFERDKLRTNSWRYRDWVVDALNADTPYDQFARSQLAGDVLHPANPREIIATGFLVAGPYDEVGQTQQSAAMRAVVRQDELEDLVSVVGQTFLGLTVHCARCHDHKFDPVSQVEYYRLAAALAGVHHGERQAAPTDHSFARALAARREALARQLEAIEQPVRERLLAQRRREAEQAAAERTPDAAAGVHRAPRPILEWSFDDEAAGSADPASSGIRSSSGDAASLTLVGDAKVADGRLAVDGKSAYAVSPLQPVALNEKTLEAWVSLADLSQQGGAAISVQSPDGAAFDAIVFGEREGGRWMAGSDGFSRTQSFGGEVETGPVERLIHIAIAWSADGRIAAYRNGAPYGRPYQTAGTLSLPAGGWQVLLGLRHSPPGGNRFLSGAIARARVYDRALSAEEVRDSSARGPIDACVSPHSIAEQLSPAERERAEALRFEIGQLAEHEARAKADHVYAVTPKPPAPTYVLHRGNPAQPGEEVAAGGVSAVGGAVAEFGLPRDASDGSRRRALAEWIAAPGNSLFARVMVNRVWRWHFGEGLVESASDFGFSGGRPSHPELLDWLACEFERQGFSLKSLHRMICVSSVYRQTSASREQCAAVDAGSRLLWRKPPLRLEAEAVRDAALAVAGELDCSLGGPGFYDFQTYVMNSQFYEMRDPIGALFQRRSLYRTWVRSGRSALLDVFDCPDPSTKTPRRAVTTTPLQALALLNDSFMLRMADQFAARLRREAGQADTPRQVELAFRLAYGRPPSADESRLTTAFAADHGLPALCRVLLNGNEFLFVD